MTGIVPRGSSEASLLGRRGRRRYNLQRSSRANPEKSRVDASRGIFSITEHRTWVEARILDNLGCSWTLSCGDYIRLVGGRRRVRDWLIGPAAASSHTYLAMITSATAGDDGPSMGPVSSLSSMALSPAYRTSFDSRAPCRCLRVKRPKPHCYDGLAPRQGQDHTPAQQYAL